MADDPYTLVVAVDSKGEAEGSLYIDDGHSFEHKNNVPLPLPLTLPLLLSLTQTQDAFLLCRFRFSQGELQSAVTVPSATFRPANRIERVIVSGLPAKPREATFISGEKYLPASICMLRRTRQYSWR
jgi:alpha 1,3-glucosidase